METHSADPAQGSTPRGLPALVNRFFAWEHLVLVGVTACLALSLLCYLYIAASRALISYALFPLSLMLFGLMLYKKKLLRYPDMKLLFAAFIWLNIVCILNVGRENAAANFAYYTNACAIALLCFPLAYVVSEKRRMKTLNVLAWIWSVPVACSAVFGIALVATGTTLYRESDGAVAGIKWDRLALICDSNMYGLLCCMALCLVLYLLLGKRKPVIRALLILAALCLYIALTLTDCRSANYSFLIAAFFFAAIPAFRLLQERSRLSRLIRLFVSAIAGAVFVALLLLGSRGIHAAANRLAAIQAQAPAAATPLTPAITPEPTPAITPSITPEPTPAVAVTPETAPAAVPEPAAPASGALIARGLADVETIYQRLDTWSYALHRLTEEKDVLVRGATPAQTHAMFMRPDTPFNHLHNSYLSVLISYGVPGFLLMLAFLVYLAICFCRIVFSSRRDMPLAIRFLPVMLLPILAANFFEEMLFTRNFVSELDVWLAILGGYTAVLSRQWRSSASKAK